MTWRRQRTRSEGLAEAARLTALLRLTADCFVPFFVCPLLQMTMGGAGGKVEHKEQGKDEAKMEGVTK